MPRQKMRRRRGIGERSTPWLRFCATVLWLPIGVIFKLRWRHAERIPLEGPAILLINHVSYADPFAVARFVYDAGRSPRFLAKASLFPIAVVGAALRGTGQIPVSRGTADARQSLDAAVKALRRGEVLIVYPEGTVTRDPEWWPMQGKTGAARLALLDPDVPVIPMAQWGAQFAVDVYNKRYRLIPRKMVTITVGEPLDLSAFRDAAPTEATPTAETLRAMTDVMMTAVRDELAGLRGVPAPTGPFRRYGKTAVEHA